MLAGKDGLKKVPICGFSCIINHFDHILGNHINANKGRCLVHSFAIDRNSASVDMIDKMSEIICFTCFGILSINSSLDILRKVDILRKSKDE